MKHTRRDMLAHSARVAGMLAAMGMLPAIARAQAAKYESSAFEAKNMADLMKALGGNAPALSKDISLTAPDIAENGAVVPIAVSTGLDGVKRLLITVEKNPTFLSAMFDVNESIEPNFSTRVKMAQSSNVYAVAMMNDGRALYAVKEVKVTLGGCGG